MYVDEFKDFLKQLEYYPIMALGWLDCHPECKHQLYVER